MDILMTGQKLAFKVPDAFNHENEVRNFVIAELQGKQHLMYYNNACSCKDFWIKFKDIGEPGNVTLETLREYLIRQYKPTEGVISDYPMIFDSSSLTLID